NILNSATPGTMTVNGGLSLGGGRVNYKLRNATTVGAGVNDLINISGTLTLSAANFRPTFVEGTFSTSPYTLVNGADTVSGGVGGLTTTLPRGLTATFGTTPSTLTVTFGGVATPGTLTFNTGGAGGNW